MALGSTLVLGGFDTGFPIWVVAAGLGLISFWGGATLVEKA